jgi:hypothetical protein
VLSSLKPYLDDLMIFIVLVASLGKAEVEGVKARGANKIKICAICVIELNGLYAFLKQKCCALNKKSNLNY